VDGSATPDASSPPAEPARVPSFVGIDQLAAAAQSCHACELAGPATQTVFSKGSAAARIALVGEQPGDVEDQQGRPFVGPAGQLLTKAIGDAGLEPTDCYVTNAVKHFRFTQDAPGRRRIHQTPELRHLAACRPWLSAELAIVDPEVVVLLGATAGKALLGPDFRVLRQRGQLIPRFGRGEEPARRALGWFVATLHPSAVLRSDDPDAAYATLVSDLRLAASAVAA
jgi:uracil-DNA glycosylase family protein